MSTVLGFRSPLLLAEINVAALAIIVIVLLFLVVWARQFIQLMMFSDSDFPGRYDKPIWAVLFIAAFVIAPFLFIYWKSAYLTMRADARKEKKS